MATQIEHQSPADEQRDRYAALRSRVQELNRTVNPDPLRRGGTDAMKRHNPWPETHELVWADPSKVVSKKHKYGAEVVTADQWEACECAPDEADKTNNCIRYRGDLKGGMILMRVPKEQVELKKLTMALRGIEGHTKPVQQLRELVEDSGLASKKHIEGLFRDSDDAGERSASPGSARRRVINKLRAGGGAGLGEE